MIAALRLVLKAATATNQAIEDRFPNATFDNIYIYIYSIPAHSRRAIWSIRDHHKLLLLDVMHQLLLPDVMHQLLLAVLHHLLLHIFCACSALPSAALSEQAPRVSELDQPQTCPESM
jgi:hypothetical protein